MSAARAPAHRDEDPAPSLFAVPWASEPFELFRLLSSSGFTVYANEAGRLVTSGGERNGDGARIVAFRIKTFADVLFIMTIDPVIKAIDIAHDGLRARVLSFTAVDLGRIRKLALRHPGHGAFVAAAPDDGGAEVDLSSNREKASEWETLELVPFDAKLPPEFSRIVEGMSRALDGHATAEELVSWLRDEPADIIAGAGAAVLRVATPEMLGRIGIAAAHTPALLDRLVSLVPDDTWITVALRDLAVWLPQRPVSKRLSIGRDLDHLPTVCANHKATSSLGSRLVTQARRHVEPRRSLAVLATARNEGLYFLEFIAHYIALGAEHIFIYSNNNNDSSDELLAALADAGVITWIDNVFVPHVDGQVKAYSHYLSFLPDGLDFEWTLIVDLDEFVVLDTNRYSSLPDLLRERRAQGANAVAMSWMMFMPGGQLRWDAAPLIARFDQREPHDNAAVKSVFITREVVTSHPHDPVFTPGVEVTYLGATGERHWWPGRDLPPSSGVPLYQGAWINHYFSKSAEEYIWKISRNRGGFVIQESLQADPERLGTVASWFEAETPRDRQAHRHLAGLEAELAKLRAIPGVAEAEAKVVGTFHARVDQLREDMVAALANIAEDVAWKSGAARVLTHIADEAGETTPT